MASPSTVLTLGYGSWGSVNLVPTLGYGIAEEEEIDAPITRDTIHFHARHRDPIPFTGRATDGVSFIGRETDRLDF